MPTIADNLRQVYRQIASAAEDAGRSPETVRLLAVSKGQPADALRECHAAGQRDFGENYLQEALDKQQALADLDDICWHFIGPIQANKTRKIAEHFDWVHSIDRRRVAERLSTQRSAEQTPLEVCIQVNIDREESKSGVTPEEAGTLAESVAALPHLRLRGLMAIPRNRDDIAAQRQAFARLAELLRTLRHSTGIETLDTLSMGMSRDLTAAVAEGATIVRIGTAIFGPRQTRA
jgi:pyridoxal phosphate enzyme (YggS family)